MNTSVAAASGIARDVCGSMIDGQGSAAVSTAFRSVIATRLRRAVEEKANEGRNARQYDNPDHYVTHMVSSPVRGKRASSERVG